MSHRSTSSSSSAGDEQYRSESLSKTDSGYSDGEERTAGEKVLEGWSALKKAVAGFAGEGATENGQGKIPILSTCEFVADPSFTICRCSNLESIDDEPRCFCRYGSGQVEYRR